MKAQRLIGKQKLQEACDYAKEQAIKEFEKNLEVCGVFERYRNCNFDNIEECGIPDIHKENFRVAKEYAKQLEKHMKDGTGLILRGPCGTLKTSIAVAILQELIATNRRGFFVGMPSLLDTIFTLTKKNTEEWVNFENKLRNTQLLVIDDLGAEYQNGWVLNKVDAIVSERYNRCRATIITTNMTSEQMKSTYAERVIDRLRSTCDILTFIGQSLRGTEFKAS
ncbi:MAG: replication protein DnaC [Firmicutes bacterium]|nr:replication protein DnaC [Bacillota bacterium]